MTLDEWKPESAVKPGEAGVRRAICKRQAAYLKKAVSSDGCHRAAHEKIAGDLANALGFAVPPVLLFRDADGERYALSLEIFEQPMTLAEIKRLGQWNAASADACAQYLQAASVFHTWIMDTDRSDNNVVVDAAAPEAIVPIAVIDHSFSMSHKWRPGLPVRRPPILGMGALSVAMPAVASAVKAVLGFEESRISEIVNRIPGDFASSGTLNRILDCLLTRRQQLGAAFG